MASGRSSTAIQIVLLALLALGLGSYAWEPSARAPFYLDDHSSIINATAVHMTEISFASIQRALLEGDLAGRPVANLSFALNHRFGGLDPRGYHVTNVFIHLGSALSLAWLSWLLITHGPAGSARDRGRAVLIAGVVATLFLVHPLCTQAITYIVQRMASLAAFFTLLSLASYIAARRSSGLACAGLFGVSAVSALLGFGSKEIAFMLLPVLLLYELCFWRESWLVRLAPALQKLRSPRVLVALALLGVALLVLGQPWLRQAWEAIQYYDSPDRDYSSIQRMLTETRVVFFYVSLLLWPAPSRLSLEHEFDVSWSLLDPPLTLLALLGWLAVGALGIWLARDRPRYGFPLLAFMAFNAIESGPLLIELIFEHRFYLPMTLLFALAAVALADAPPRVGAALSIGLLLLALPLAAASRVRNETWVDPVGFYRDAVQKAPRHFRALYEFASQLGMRGHYEESLAMFQRALELKPDSAHALTQAGTASAALGRASQAYDYYRASLAVNPHDPETLFNIGVLLDSQGRFDLARPYLEHFLETATPDLAPQVVQVRARLSGAPGEPGQSP